MKFNFVNVLILILLPINALFDVLTNVVFTSGGIFSYIRAIIMLLIIVTVLFRFKQNKLLFKPFLIFTLYVLIQLPFSSNLIYSLSMSLKVLIPILTFFIGYSLIKSIDKLKLLNWSLLLLMMIISVNFFISNKLGLGVDVYSKSGDFLVGNINDNWNIITYSLLVTPLLYKYNNSRILIIIFSVFSLGLLFMSMKRIAILGLFVGAVIFLYSLNLKKILKWIFITVILVAFTFPFYGPKLVERLATREDKFQSNQVEVIQEEYRFLETIAVFSETITFNNPLKSIFGLNPFNSIGNYVQGAFGDRQLHVDYNLILNTIGIVGLILYLNIFVRINNYRKKLIKVIGEGKIKDINIIFKVLFFAQFITSFGGQMYQITFRTIIFIYLGAILGLMNRHFKMIKHDI